MHTQSTANVVHIDMRNHDLTKLGEEQLQARFRDLFAQRDAVSAEIEAAYEEEGFRMQRELNRHITLLKNAARAEDLPLVIDILSQTAFGETWDDPLVAMALATLSRIVVMHRSIPLPGTPEADIIMRGHSRHGRVA
jgi:hypothetical protein